MPRSAPASVTPLFRAMPPKIQEESPGTSFETLRTMYDDVTPDDMRRAAVETRINRSRNRQ